MKRLGADGPDWSEMGRNWGAVFPSAMRSTNGANSLDPGISFQPSPPPARTMADVVNLVAVVRHAKCGGSLASFGDSTPGYAIFACVASGPEFVASIARRGCETLRGTKPCVCPEADELREHVFDLIDEASPEPPGVAALRRGLGP